MSQVLLIYPPDRQEDQSPETPPLGLAHLASFIRSQLDCKVSIWDLNLNRISQDQFRENLLKLEDKPDIIGIGGIVTVFNNFLWMSKICKEVFPESLLMAGGSLASTVPHLLFTHSPVDVCVKGEGEYTLLEIIKNKSNGASKNNMQNIQGIFLWDKEGEHLIATSPRPRTPDLDAFGMPAYDLLDIAQYAVNGIRNLKAYRKDLPPQIFSSGNLHLPIMTSRGCTSQCTFCYRQFSKISMNSPQFIKKHIEFLHTQYGINVFTIIDELFNLSERRMNELVSCFAEIKQKIPEFYFRIGGARVDLIDTEYLKKLKTAGCFQIIYGLESGSQKMLDSMKKRVTVEQNRKAVMAAKEAGLHCVPQFVIGLPGEERTTLSETIDFIRSIDFWSHLSIHRANAYPGSEIYQSAKEKGLIKDEFAYVSSLAGTDVYPLQLADISLREMSKIVRRYSLRREFLKNKFPVAVFNLVAKALKKVKTECIKRLS